MFGRKTSCSRTRRSAGLVWPLNEKRPGWSNFQLDNYVAISRQHRKAETRPDEVRRGWHDIIGIMTFPGVAEHLYVVDYKFRAI